MPITLGIEHISQPLGHYSSTITTCNIGRESAPATTTHFNSCIHDSSGPGGAKTIKNSIRTRTANHLLGVRLGNYIGKHYCGGTSRCYCG